MTSRRETQAEQTRQDIVKAARELFLTQGFEATTMKDIAAHAGVSVQTLYDSVGGKAALVSAMNDSFSRQVRSADVMKAALESGSVDELLAVPARVSIAYLHEAGDMVRMASRTSEPKAQDIIELGRKRHNAGARRVAEALAAQGALRADLDARRAADTIAALSDVQYLLILRDGYGWSTERIRAFVTEQLRAALLP